MLGAVSYHGVLTRGFALVRDEANRPLRRAAEVRPAEPVRIEPVRIEFADGVVAAAVAEGPAPVAAAQASPNAPPGAGQTRALAQSRRGARDAVLTAAAPRPRARWAAALHAA